MRVLKSQHLSTGRRFLSESELARALGKATFGAATASPDAPATGLNLEMPRIYEATIGMDGKVRVPNVPIFGENVRQSSYGETLVYSKKWLKTALKNDAALRASGYSMPLHFGHHEAGIVRERAGSVELTAVRLCMYIGKPLWTLFGTLIFKDQASYEKAKLDFPYRSVEISTGDRPDEVNSLALLSSEAPYFRFPNMTYRSLPDRGNAFIWRQKFMSEIAGAEAFAVSRTKGLPVPAADSRPGSPTPTKAPGKKNPPATSAENSTGDDGSATAYDVEDVAASADSDDQSDADFGSIMKRMMALEAVVAKLMSSDADVDQSSADADDDADKSKADADGDDQSEADADDMSKADADDSDADADYDADDSKAKKKAPIVSAKAGTLAHLEGKLARQEAELAQIRSERAGEKLFSTLRPKLQPYKLANLDAELRKRCADGSAKEWAAGILTAPPRGVRYSETPNESAPEAPEVAKYRAHGPEAHAKARDLALAYASVSSSHLIRKNPLSAFLASNMAATGLVKE